MSQWAHRIRAVAFDMDGLMVNTEDLYTIVGETILARRGRKFTRELKNCMMGLPGAKAWQLMIDHEQLTDSTLALAEESDEVFSSLLTSQLQTLPGLIELLDHLDAQGTRRCVATSSSRKLADQVLRIADVLQRVEFVVTAEDVEHGKPAPDIYREAARRMGVEPHEMMVLEDSHHGSRAGIAAGACTIAVPGEHSRDQDFGGVCAQAASLTDPVIHALLA